MSIMVWNKIYRRSLFDGLRFAEGYMHEDVQITPILLNRAERIGALNRLIYNYNIHLGTSSTSGMKINAFKVRSMVEMNCSVYEYFVDSQFKRVSRHVAGLYFNSLLYGYYMSSSHRGAEWDGLKDVCRLRISSLKPSIKSFYYTAPYRIYFVSPLLFRLVKRSVIKAKQLKYSIRCKLTGKNWIKIPSGRNFPKMQLSAACRE